MEGKNPGKNQPYILDVSVETIELKKRKSSTVHENSQPKVAKIPVMIKFVKNKATDISKTNRESSLIEESNQTEEVSNVTETSNVKEKPNVINYVTRIDNVQTEVSNAKEASILRELLDLNKEVMSEEKKSSSSRKSKIVSNVKTLRKIYFRKIAPKVSVSDSRSKLQCNICDKTFQSTNDVENHVKSDHAQLNPKQCSLCDMYLSESAFDVHVALVHEGKKWTELYKCSFKNCKVKFVTKSALREHFYSAHGWTDCGWKKLHLCRICDRTFELEHLLKVA